MEAIYMKFRLTEDMRKKIWLYVIVIAIGISIYFAFDKIDFIIRSLRRVCSLTTPFILGFAIAFLLNKPMKLIEVKLLGRLRMKPQHKRSIAAVLAVLLGIIIVCAFLALLLPQLFDSIFSLVKAFPGYVEDFQKFALDFVEKYAIDTQQVTNYITDTDFFEKLTGFVTDALPQMAKATYAFGSTLLNILLSIMAGLYMLIDKERLSGYAKKINYALFPKEISEYLHRMVLASGDIFNNFIVGKAIDSLIIGVLCFILMNLFKLPFALLISVIVGVTNVIPFFGPFIGAIPSAVLVFLISPRQCLYFVGLVLVLQQFDGNILGPKILGDKTGLRPIWIIFAITVGGWIGGIVGMFLGVPCVAVISSILDDIVEHNLEKQNVNLPKIKHESNSKSFTDYLKIISDFMKVKK